MEHFIKHKLFIFEIRVCTSDDGRGNKWFYFSKKKLLCVVCSSCHIYFWVPSFLCPKSMLCNYRKWIQTRQKIGAAAEMLVKKNVIDHRHSYVCSFLQVGSRWKMTVFANSGPAFNILFWITQPLGALFKKEWQRYIL